MTVQELIEHLGRFPKDFEVEIDDGMGSASSVFNLQEIAINFESKVVRLS